MTISSPVPDRTSGSSLRRLSVAVVGLLAASLGCITPLDESASAATPVVEAASITALPMPAPAAESPSVKIMPLGDSITVGVGSSTRSGYRADLAKRLAAAGLRADFVGSQQAGTGWDIDNEGHVGWSIEQIAANVDDWLATYQPDVILLHIGTNDTRSANSAVTAPEKLSALIDQIRADRPTAEIFVSEIISTTDARRNVLTNAYNAQVPGVVAGKDARVHLVDQSTVGGHDLFNMLHPNDLGYAKMSYNWYRALEPVLGSADGPWPAGANPYAETKAYLCTAFECRWWERRIVTRTADGVPARTRVWQTLRTVNRSHRVHVRGHYRVAEVGGRAARTWVAPHTVVRYRKVAVWVSR